MIRNEIVVDKSRFIGLAFPLSDSLDFRQFKSEIKKEYAGASHVTYAYKAKGVSSCSDDKEPPHTAGSQILMAIEKFKLSDVAVVVVRYFGGKKLGKKNLALAYRTCAEKTIETYLGGK